MSHYLKLSDGRLIRTEDFVEVSKEEVQTVIDQHKSEASDLEALIAEEAPAEQPAPETPAEPTPTPEQEVAQEAGANPEQPATVEVNGQEVQLNADGTLNIDTTPEQPAVTEPAPAQPQPIDPVAAAAGVAPQPTPQPAQPAPVVLQ